MPRSFIAACLLACATAPRTRASTPAVEAWLARARQSFSETWVPAMTAAAKRNDPTGCLYSTEERRTVLAWRVSREGDLSGVRIATSSGVDYLDRVALEAVEAVHKLEAPPPELFDGPGDRELPFAFRLLGVGRQSCEKASGGSTAR